MNRRSLLVAALLAAAALVQVLPRAWAGALLPGVRVLCDLVAIAAVVQQRRSGSEGRPMWGFVLAGLVLFLVGDLYAGIAFQATFLRVVPEWASTLVLHVLPIPMFILAMLSWQRSAKRSPVPQAFAVLDGLLFSYAAMYLIWVLGLRHWTGASLDSQASWGLLVRFILLSLLLGLCVYRGSRNPFRWRGPMAYLGLAFLLLTLASAFSAAAILGKQSPVLRMIANVLKPAAILLVAGAGWCSLPHSGGPESGRRALMEGLRDHLPFLPAALATLAALLYTRFDGALGDPRVVLYGAPMVGLLLLRQFRAMQELKAFSLDLETKVEARTRALEAAQAVAMRTERMNAVATLGAGLAHDLNNSLAAIRASAELLAEDLHDGRTPELKDVDRILVASDQAASLSRRLMAFGREEPRSVFDLGEEIHGMEDLLRMLLPRRIQLRIALSPGRYPVSGTRSHLEQILVNLISNARDAIEAEGSISVELLGSTGPVGREALVRVVDTGSGMDEEVRARLFEPFFSTKAPGRGTGLGLASVKALLEQESGSIDVDSQPGLGTSFTLRFPLAG